MELLEPNLNVEVSEDFEQIEFTMKTSREVFKIWSDTLYSDKITAIIRELSTNAVDSHIAAGKSDEPFTVHLPNSLEPYFSVSDNGIGMSDAFIRKNYTCYFDSTKRKDNTQTGCYGIGSKSPFAYTDNFNIISRYNGTKIIYNAFINEHGIPVLVKVEEQPSTEHNGLEIKFAVNKYDFNSFYTKAANVLSRFQVKPIIKGYTLTYPKFEYLKEGKDWKIHKQSKGQSWVVMGNIAYPFGIYDLKLSDNASKICNWGVDLHMPLGSVQITPSREKISFDTQTILNINSKLEEISRIIKDDTEKDFQKIPTIWKARLELLKFIGSVIANIIDLTKLQWNGKKLSTSILGNDIGKPLIWEYSKRYASNKYRRQTYNDIYHINYPIYINDLGKDRPSHLRMLKELNSKNIHNAYMISERYDSNGNVIPFDHKLIEDSGLNEVLIKVSSLPKPDKVPSTKTGPKVVRTMMRQYKVSSSSEPAAFWEGLDVDITKPGVFIPMVCHKFKNYSGDWIHPRDLQPIINCIQTLNGTTYNIYGSNERNIEGLIKNGWTNFNDIIKKTLDDNIGYLEKNSVVHAFDVHNYNNLAFKMSKNTLLKHPFLAEMQTHYQNYIKYKGDAKTAQFQNLLRLVKTNLVIPTSKIFDEFTKKLHNQYPLIPHLDLYSAKSGLSVLKAIEQYMYLVDALKKNPKLIP